jgi:ABC-type dipeptide/oligopeptide/nickel transport system permease subunit
MTMIVLLCIVALLAPVLAPFSPSAQASEYVLQGPGAGGHHLRGTDEYGRDLLSRML